MADVIPEGSGARAADEVAADPPTTGAASAPVGPAADPASAPVEPDAPSPDVASAATDTPISAAAPAAVDPRAVRVAIAASTALPGEDPIVVAPPPEPLAPLPVTFAGRGVLGGVAIPHDDHAPDLPPPSATYLLDGEARTLRLDRRGPDRATLEGPGAGPARRVVFSGPPSVGADGVTRREVVVDGWRFELEIEPERRAALRERARRGREATSRGGPTEVHAIIPGRVVAVSIAPGDAVTAGQQILVVEAMKMQNELRAPRDGTVRQVGVSVGTTIEVGDLLLVIE